MASASRIPDSTQSMTPTSSGERIDVVDILRGWAVLGMLVVNFSYDLDWTCWFTKLWPGTADRLAYFLVRFFAAGKFHALFSFLFGWGFALQMDRAEARGQRFFAFYARRLFVLLLIGLANLVLFNWDETLLEYALTGYLLFLFRARSPKLILAAAFLCACYWPAHDALVIHNHARRLADPRTVEATRQADAEEETEEVAREEDDLQLALRGSFREIVARAAGEAAEELSSMGYYLGLLGYPFPLLLLGFYAGRRRILHDVPAHSGFLRKVFWWGLGLGLLGNGVGVLVSTYPGHYQAPWSKSWIGDAAFNQVGIPALCFCYASAIVLLAQKPAWKVRFAPLVPVGRMALSNYLLQIIIFDFLAYGLRSFGKFGPLLGIAIGLVVFLLEVLLSVCWMRRFRFGPVEWLWRSLTYGRLQSMSIATARGCQVSEPYQKRFDTTYINRRKLWRQLETRLLGALRTFLIKGEEAPPRAGWGNPPKEMRDGQSHSE